MLKQFFSADDVSDIDALLRLAHDIKKSPFNYGANAKNKTVGHLFFNPSLRTRLSCQKAAMNLGANEWTLNAGTDSWKLETEDGIVMSGDSQEHIKEAIRVMSSYCDVLAVRTFPSLKDKEKDYSEYIFNKIIENSSVPVVNLESATLHPLQSFADLITIDEYKQAARVKVVLTWAPHVKALPQAVSNSFAQWMTRVDWIDLTIVQPKGFELDEKFTQGTNIMYHQKEAFEGANFIYAKNWSSYANYGQIAEYDQYKSWEITKDKMDLTDNGKFMHCLPVRRNVIVSDQVLDSPTSIVTQQANNRIFSAQTVYHELFK